MPLFLSAVSSWIYQLYRRNPRTWIFVFSLALFCQVLGFEFIHYDDVDIIRSYSSSELNFESIKRALFGPLWSPELSPQTFYYRPIVSLASLILTVATQSSSTLIHAFTLLMHASVSVLLFQFLKRIQTSPSHSFTLALIFAAHPLASSITGWMGGLNDSILAFFSILAAISLLNYLDTKKVYWLVINAGCLLFALGTKENAWFLAPILMTLMKPSGRRSAFHVYFIWILIYALYFITRAEVIHHGPSLDLNSLITLSPGVFIGILIGFGKILIPFHPQVMPTAQPLDIFLGMASVTALTILAIRSSQSRWRVLWGVSWFLCFYGPTLLHHPLLSGDNFILREDRLYTAMIGLIVVLSGLSIKISKWTLIPLILITVFHTYSYRGRAPFWEKAVQNNEIAFSRLHYGDTFTDSGDYSSAMEWYQKAYKINPKQYLVNNNRGVILLRLNRLDEAEKAFNEELAHYPKDIVALRNLADTKSKQGDREAAYILYQHIIGLYPKNILALQNGVSLGIEFKQKEKVFEYLDQLKKLNVSIPLEIIAEIQKL